MPSLEVLLSTKLMLPPTRGALVERPRLEAHARAALAYPLTLVTAPPGYGKTTLLSTTLRRSGMPIAWVALDADDNDPARFWSYVIAALEQVEVRGEHAAWALRSVPAPPIEAVLTHMINVLAALPHEIVLALDDYHLIESPAIHAALVFLLDHMPPQLHLALASRTTPPLPLERLRVRGQLAELFTADLRFTPEEATALLNQVMGLDLSAEASATLVTRTEGWGAGLLLAALSLRGHADPSAFIDAFHGGHRYILDYVATEVLRRQPTHVQTFLLHTAVLDRMCAPLCDALMGIENAELKMQNDLLQHLATDSQFSILNSQFLLEDLERAHLFLIPLDEERRWYRYHHLFVEVLRVRLRQDHPTLLPALHQRAAAWHEQHGLMDAAVGHALAGRDWDRAARLMARLAHPMLMRGEVTTLREWLGALPQEVRRAWPSLRLTDAWLMMLVNDLEEAEQCIREVGDAGGPHDDQAFQDELAVMRMMIAALQGASRSAIMLTREQLDRLSRDAFLHSIAMLGLGFPAIYSGAVDEAIRAFEAAARISEQGGNLLVAFVALCQLAEARVWQGRLRESAETYQRAQALLGQRDGQPLPIIGMAYVGLGELARERNDLALAARYFQDGIALCEQLGEVAIFDGYIGLVRVKLAQRAPAEAEELIRRAARIAGKLDIELSDVLLAVHQAQVWLSRGDAEAAERCLDVIASRAMPPEDHPDFPAILREIVHMKRASILIARGQFVAALDLLAELIEPAESAGRDHSVVEGLILRALALAGCGESESALAALSRALALAAPEGYVRLFVDQGAPLAELLWRLPAPSAEQEYLERLLAAFSADDKVTRWQDDKVNAAGNPSPPHLVTPTPIEALSERERQVLQLIAAGYSNPEIAERLVVTPGTVKKHINHIFGKLRVRSRTQALVRARALGLLP